jgi:hypothetical protein
MSDQASKFVDRKGTLEQMENYNIIRIFSSKENPSFFPCHKSNKMCVAKITRQYHCCLHFFHGKRKKTIHTSALESWGLHIQKYEQD